jgi:hypothetical protein
MTEPSWLADVAGTIIYAEGEPRTMVATLRRGAPPAKLLAAAPHLLRAVKAAKTILEAPPAWLESRKEAAYEILKCCTDAIITATGPSATVLEHPWTINAELPESERKENDLLLAAAKELSDAALKAHGFLATCNPKDAAVDLLHTAILRSDRTLPLP